MIMGWVMIFSSSEAFREFGFHLKGEHEEGMYHGNGGRKNQTWIGSPHAYI